MLMVRKGWRISCLITTILQVKESLGELDLMTFSTEAIWPCGKPQISVPPGDLEGYADVFK